jgi:hypothetical protein
MPGQIDIRKTEHCRLLWLYGVKNMTASISRILMSPPFGDLLRSQGSKNAFRRSREFRAGDTTVIVPTRTSKSMNSFNPKYSGIYVAQIIYEIMSTHTPRRKNTPNIAWRPRMPARSADASLPVNDK